MGEITLQCHQSKTEEKTLFVLIEEPEKDPLVLKSKKPQNLPLRVIQELKKLAVDVEVASVPSQEVENGRRDYLLKTIIELSTILWQDGSCQGELGEWQERS